MMSTMDAAHQSPGRAPRVDCIIRDAIKSEKLSVVQILDRTSEAGVAEPVAIMVLVDMLRHGEIEYHAGAYRLSGAPRQAGGGA